MNKTKRKIFETSMKLFAEKGYDATSIEEITATVGVAKGTLYYHFSSKEEIFNFLVEEGMKLLKNSIEIKTSKFIKVLAKYEHIITIILSQFWGTESRNIACKSYVLDYIKTIEDIIITGMEKGELPKGNAKIIASTIFSITSSILVYKNQTGQSLDIHELYNEYQDIIINGLLNAKGN